MKHNTRFLRIWPILPFLLCPLLLAAGPDNGPKVFQSNGKYLLDARRRGQAGVDLWHYQTPDGRGIRAAIDYLLPFATGDKKWEYDQTNEFKANGLFAPLRRASLAYNDSKYEAAIPRLKGLAQVPEIDNLRYPVAKK